MIFNEGRRHYYMAKKRELARQRQAKEVVKEDALFIKYYGMDAYLELFPEAKDFGINWHREVIQELKELEKKQLGSLLGGIYSASGATKDKKMNRSFRKIIKGLMG